MPHPRRPGLTTPTHLHTHSTTLPTAQRHATRTQAPTTQHPTHQPSHFNSSKRAGPWICQYNDRVDELKSFGAGNTETVAQLLHSFFHYWAKEHDYSWTVVSMRTLRPVTKVDKDW